MSTDQSTAHPYGSAGCSKAGTRALFVAVVAAGGFLLAACGNEALDAPVQGGDGSVDLVPARVIAFPDDYGNVATKCDEFGNRVYSSSNNKGAAIFVVAADRSCQK